MTSVFSAREKAVLRAFAETAFPSLPGLPGALDAAIPEDAYDRLFAGQDAPTIGTVRKALFAFQHGTHLFAFTWRPFTRLPPGRRERYLAGWEASRFYWKRMVCLLLKMVTGMAYTASPAVEQAIGYSSRCLHEGYEGGAPR